MEPTLAELERLLGGVRPQPNPEFVRELETSLVRSLSKRRVLPWARMPAPRKPRLVAAVGAAGALAAIALVLGLAGALPLHVGDAPDATADRDCRTVLEWRLERTPRLVVDRRNLMRLRYTTEMVQRRAIRCH
jgi:hypothetical protein